MPWKAIIMMAAELVLSHRVGLVVLANCNCKSDSVRNVLIIAREEPYAAFDPIPSLLQTTRNFRASDPRDKVYA